MATMNKPRTIALVRHTFIAALFALGACAPLVEIGGAEGPPARIFDIAPQAVNAGQTLETLSAPVVILVEEPTSSSILDRDRIAVRLNGGEIKYLPNVRFAERPARLIRRAVQDSLEQVNGLTALGRGALDIPSDYRLKLVVRDFQVNSNGPGREESAVSLQALLIDGTGALIASKTFDRRQSLPSTAPDNAIEGLTDGLSNAAADIRAWLLDSIRSAQ